MEKKNELVSQGNEIVKRKKAGNGASTFSDNGYNYDSEDDKKNFLMASFQDNFQYFNAPLVKNEDEATVRINQMVKSATEHGLRPTWEKVALCLGTTRASLWDWETGRRRGPISADFVKKVKEFIASYDADAVASGKLNPVTYIFRSKNYYGMKDQQEYVLTPNTNVAKEADELLEQANMLPDEE